LPAGGPGGGGESSGDPGCGDPVGNVGLEVAVSSNSENFDPALSELIVFHSVADTSVRYPTFVDD
jgi:hypothetical protein